MPVTQFTSGAFTSIPSPGLWSASGSAPALGPGTNLLGASGNVAGIGGIGPLAVSIRVDGFDPPLDNTVLALPGAFGLATGITGLTSILTFASAPVIAVPVSRSTPYAKLPNWKCGNWADWCIQHEICNIINPFARKVRADLDIAHSKLPCVVEKDKWSYQDLPQFGRELRESGSIALPGPIGNVLVHEWLTPKGWSTALWALQLNFTGFGNVQGAGYLTFRIQINSHWLKDLGNIDYELGTTGLPQLLTSPVLIPPHARVQVWVEVSAAGAGVLDPAGRVVSVLQGFVWPRDTTN